MIDNNKLSGEMLLSSTGSLSLLSGSEGLMMGGVATQFSTHDGGPRQRV